MLAGNEFHAASPACENVCSQNLVHSRAWGDVKIRCWWPQAGTQRTVGSCHDHVVQVGWASYHAYLNNMVSQSHSLLLFILIRQISYLVHVQAKLFLRWSVNPAALRCYSAIFPEGRKLLRNKAVCVPGTNGCNKSMLVATNPNTQALMTATTPTNCMFKKSIKPVWHVNVNFRTLPQAAVCFCWYSHEPSRHSISRPYGQHPERTWVCDDNVGHLQTLYMA